MAVGTRGTAGESSADQQREPRTIQQRNRVRCARSMLRIMPALRFNILASRMQRGARRGSEALLRVALLAVESTSHKTDSLPSTKFMCCTTSSITNGPTPWLLYW